jgi:exodeoxyribonuclease V alpha subunit
MTAPTAFHMTLVVIGESSMVSLTLMGRLLEALRPGGRLVLAGDPGQLASVEADTVLGDLVQAATTPEAPRTRSRSR